MRCMERGFGCVGRRYEIPDGVVAVFSDFVQFDGPLEKLRLELWINDQLIQDGGYELMMNKPEDILAEAGSFLSFEDGDVIMSGTPKGVGPINSGDRLHGKILVYKPAYPACILSGHRAPLLRSHKHT